MDASLPPVARDLTDMANIATSTPMSGTAVAGSCASLAENSTTVSTKCLPSESDVSTSSIHHSVSSVPVISVRSTLRCPVVSAPANTETWPPTSNSHVSKIYGSPPPTGYGVPSQAACTPTSLSPITTTPFTQGTGTLISSGTPGAFQGTRSTSAPPSITSTGLTTLADGTVVPMTQAMANSAQDASGSPPRHA
jgi:hypothetical protein